MTKTHCACHQWLEKSKPIIELRAVPYEIAFPGFANFSATVEELSLLPLSWQNSLSSVQGVYLLVCPNTGEQYVGSATGTGGCMGRWNAYAKNSHGDNRMLKERLNTVGQVNFAITILEVASPDMSASDVVARESAWKHKLGSRAFGLNAN